MTITFEQRKKKCSAIALFLVLLFSSLITSLFVNLARANPTIFSDSLGNIPPDSNTKPPVVSVFAPENQTVYATNSISLSFDVSVGESSTASSKFIREIYYKADWQTNITHIYEFNPTKNPVITEPVITQFSKTLSLTGIPDGNHSFVVYAKEAGSYYSHTDYTTPPVYYAYYYNFEINGFSSVFFVVDTTPPNITVLSMQDKTFYSSDAELSFVVDEPPSRIVYCLDGQDNMTISGNTTLAGLSVGEHNVTVYAWDTAGNIGASENITFTIFREQEPFQTAPVAVASIASVVVVGVVLLVYFSKRKRQQVR